MESSWRSSDVRVAGRRPSCRLSFQLIKVLEHSVEIIKDGSVTGSNTVGTKPRDIYFKARHSSKRHHGMFKMSKNRPCARRIFPSVQSSIIPPSQLTAQAERFKEVHEGVSSFKELSEHVLRVAECGLVLRMRRVEVKLWLLLAGPGAMMAISVSSSFRKIEVFFVET